MPSHSRSAAVAAHPAALPARLSPCAATGPPSPQTVLSRCEGWYSAHLFSGHVQLFLAPSSLTGFPPRRFYSLTDPTSNGGGKSLWKLCSSYGQSPAEGRQGRRGSARPPSSQLGRALRGFYIKYDDSILGKQR